MAEKMTDKGLVCGLIIEGKGAQEIVAPEPKVEVAEKKEAVKQTKRSK